MAILRYHPWRDSRVSAPRPGIWRIGDVKTPSRLISRPMLRPSMWCAVPSLPMVDVCKHASSVRVRRRVIEIFPSGETFSECERKGSSKNHRPGSCSHLPKLNTFSSSAKHTLPPALPVPPPCPMLETLALPSTASRAPTTESTASAKEETTDCSSKISLQSDVTIPGTHDSARRS